MSVENRLLKVTEKVTTNRRAQIVGTGLGAFSGIFAPVVVPTIEAFVVNQPPSDSHVAYYESVIQLGKPVKIGDQAYTLTDQNQDTSPAAGQEILVPRDEIRIQKREVVIAKNGNYTSPMLNNEYAVFQEITEQGENGQKTIIKAKKINSPDAKPFVVSANGTTNRAEAISKNNIVVVSEGKGLYTTGIPAIDLNTGKKEIISDGDGTYVQEQAFISDDGRYVSYVTYITGQAQIEIYDRINKTKVLTISSPDSNPQNWDGLGQSFFYQGYLIHQQIIDGKWGYVGRNLKGEEVGRLAFKDTHLVNATFDETNNTIAFIKSTLTGPESDTSIVVLDTQTYEQKEYKFGRNERVNYVKTLGERYLVVNLVDKQTNSGSIVPIDAATGKRFQITDNKHAYLPQVIVDEKDPNKFKAVYMLKKSLTESEIRVIEVLIHEQEKNKEFAIVKEDSHIPLIAGERNQFVIYHKLTEEDNFVNEIRAKNTETGEDFVVATGGFTNQAREASGNFIYYAKGAGIVPSEIHRFNLATRKDEILALGGIKTEPSGSGDYAVWVNNGNEIAGKRFSTMQDLVMAPKTADSESKERPTVKGNTVAFLESVKGNWFLVVKDIKTNKELQRVFTGKYDRPAEFVISDNEQKIVGIMGNKLLVFDIKTGNIAEIFSDPKMHISNVKTSGEFVSWNADNTGYIEELTTQKRVRVGGNDVHSLDIKLDKYGRILAVYAKGNSQKQQIWGTVLDKTLHFLLN